MGERLAAIVPAHDEAARIAATVESLRTFCDEVIVVDDGSGDDTAARAEQAGATVVRLARNRGKGAALRAGLKAAAGADLLLLADGDLGASASALSALVEPIRRDDADLTIAAPAPGRPSGLGMVESLARRGIRATTGAAMARPLSGQRAMRASAAATLRIADGFGVEAAMTIDAIRGGLRVREIPCEFTHAATGRDLAGFAHRAKQGLAVARVLAPRLLRRRRTRGIVRS